MEELWTEANKYRYWAKVEAAVMRAQDHPEWWVVEGIKFDEKAIASIQEVEKLVNHDVAAFVDFLESHVDHAINSSGAHYGLTSSDVVDTALALQMTKGLGILRQKAGRLGVPLHWLIQATKEIRVGTISGPVGSYGSITPEIEAQVLGWLGLEQEPAPTQVVARDRYAYLLFALAITAAVIDRMIGIQSTEAILIRQWASIAVQNVALWHERDISHSSVERVMIPDAFMAVARLLTRLEEGQNQVEETGHQPS